ncbi:MAG: IS1182 family transposase [Enterococcus sp.]
MYKNYTIDQLVLPLDLEKTLPENDIAYSVHHLVESIPEEAFELLKHHRGASSYHPRMMLKIILCAYTQSVFSGRKIEALLQDSIRMMWLAQGYQPSYRTINRFRVDKAVQPLLQECFVQFRSQLITENEIDEEAIFIDGTKIEANANKFTFVWRKSVERHHRNLEEKSLAAYHELVEEKIIPALHTEIEENLSKENIRTILTSLEQTIDEFNQKMTDEPCGSARKELRSERKIPKLFYKHFSSHQERVLAYEKHYQILGKRNSYSKTDTDATFMRMKDDYMMNGQLKAGYNLQIATNNQYILGYDIFSNPTDTRTLTPFLSTLEKEYFPLPKFIVADAGYGSEENYMTILEKFQATPLITYGMYEKEQKKKYKNNPFQISNWDYDELSNQFTCPEGRKLSFRYNGIRNDKYGFKRQISYYECEDCSNCPVRSLCTKARDGVNRRIQKNWTWESYKTVVKKLLQEKETQKIYSRRKIDVETAFGHLKAILGFTRLSVRGTEKVKNELGFALMATNLRKYNLKFVTQKEKQNKKSRTKSFFRFLCVIFLFKNLYVPGPFFIGLFCCIRRNIDCFPS